LAKLGREDIMIVVGGVIPPQDYPALYEAGASAVFGPGTVIGEAAATLIRGLASRLAIPLEESPEVVSAGRSGGGHGS
jgi:methylmalonyl-CoA mutase